ncbi:amino acid adenylation domain-containing protein [Streptomyces sp. NPDC050256]|uniref:amino acid adenylation domain-containing protein n=1 Tax=unclassified Streptomyces TaxID=2593676 RepID=UPI0037999B44
MSQDSYSYVFGERIEQVVAHHARQAPDAVALRQGEASLTYSELVSRANTVACRLERAGVGPGDYIPVRLGRSPDLVAVLLGVLTVGAAYIAVDPGWPAARMADVVRRSGARALITDAPVPGTDGVLVLAPTELLLRDLQQRADVPTYTDGTAAACVFYTSGSTGQPKGVVSPHRGTIRTLVGCPEIPLGPSTVFLQAAPLPWDGFSLELWAPLLNGGCCLLLEADEVLDTSALRQAIRRGVETMFLTSALFALFADEAPDALGSLRLLLVGGERVSVPHFRRIVTEYPATQLVHVYGPAESTIFTTAHVVRPQDVSAESTEIPLGRPVPRTGVVLIDAQGAPVPAHERGEGELAVSGDGLALNYLADPAETAARFFDLDGERHYRTGDRAARDGRGLLFYRGRTDRQFKIRGIRVEPGEIETVLQSHPGVSSCTVARVETASGRATVGCVYTSLETAPPTGGELRAFAARSLLPAMVPSVFVPVARLPLGATGKVSQADIARILAEHPVGGAEAAAAEDSDLPGVPRPDTSSAAHALTGLLADIRDILGTPTLGARDNLFESGATSLDVLRVAARAEARLDRRTTAGDVYRCATVELLEEHGRHAPPRETPLPTAAAPPPGHLPLSHAQQRFWMAEQLDRGAADNMLVLAYLLDGPLDISTLCQALHDILVRHPVLRTAYPMRQGIPVQVVAPAPSADSILDLCELPHGTAVDDIPSAARRATEDWWDSPFDLEAEPPVRIRLYSLEEHRHLLFFHVHHIAFDGWSESVLVHDLAAAYKARLTGDTQPFAEPAPTYADYSQWEDPHVRQWLREDLPFWRDALSDVPPPALPVPDGSGIGAGEAPQRERTARIDPHTVRRLVTATGHHGGSAVAAVVAAVGGAMTRTLDVPAVCLGTATVGRDASALRSVVGYFVNPVPVLVQAPGEAGPGAFLSRTVSSVNQSLAHAKAPFDELVRSIGAHRGRHPWFQAWAVLQRQPPHAVVTPGLALSAIRVRPPRTARELVCEAFPQPDGSWDLLMQWRADGLPDRTGEELLDRTTLLIRDLAGAREPLALRSYDAPGGSRVLA